MSRVAATPISVHDHTGRSSKRAITIGVRPLAASEIPVAMPAFLPIFLKTLAAPRFEFPVFLGSTLPKSLQLISANGIVPKRYAAAVSMTI